MVRLFRRQPVTAEGVDRIELSVANLVKHRLVGCAFQPVVRLEDRAVVGFSALACGPDNSDYAAPGRLVAAAAVAGLSTELDFIAHAAAFTAAQEAALPAATALFVTAAPTTLGAPVPEDLARALIAAHPTAQVFLELSERSLAIDPVATLATVAKAHRSGWGISLADVGCTPDALVMLPFARPDAVKLDAELVHDAAHPRTARTVSAVVAHAERTGATVLALGIDTQRHLATARGLGATHGQGGLFGRTDALPRSTRPPEQPLPRIPVEPPPTAADTPWRLAAGSGAGFPVTPAVLRELGGALEHRALLDPDPSMVLACLPHNRLPSGAPLAFLETIARGAGLTAALVGEPVNHRVTGVRVRLLDRSEALGGELTLITLGPHHAALLTAIERQPGRPDEGYEYRLVHDRTTVIRAGAMVLSQLTT